MNIDKETSKRIEELQILEQRLQNFSMEKQAMQIEMNEIENALGELNKAGDEVYRILGEVMIKSTKEKLIKDFEERKKLLEIKVQMTEKQESLLDAKSEEMRKEIQESLKKNAQ